MLGVLLESRARRQRRTGGAALSVVVHVATVALVAAATTRRPQPTATASPPPDIRWVQPRPISDPPPLPPPIHETPSTAPLPGTPVLPTIVAPTIVPPSIPPIAAGPPIDFTQGVHIVTGGSESRGGGSGVAREPAPGEPWTPETADVPAAIVGRVPPPHYPDALRSANVSGRVVVRFVIDTTGRLEPSSVDVVASTHDLFERAVREALPSLRFRPAEANGHRVRMLVEMPFVFELR